MSPASRSTGMLPISTLESLSTNPSTSVDKKTATVHLAVSPTFLTNLKAGIESQLSPQLNRYYPPLKAILLGYDQLKLTSRAGALLYDSPAVHIDVQGRFFLFSPEVGVQLPGVVNKKSKGHLGCLVHDTFNVSLLAGEKEKHVMVGQKVNIEVTRVVWGHKSMPIIQGKLVRGIDPKIEETEVDFDSGIDSNLGEKKQKSKKNKKRKREVGDDDEVDVSIPEGKKLKVENEISSNEVKKKKKKKKKEDI